jgi:hypothetical protein
MKGDDRARFCDECRLRVYDISRLTRREAEALISRTEGRICARLYRRADGTILTKDCPVGLRAVKRRLARAAGAALTALLSLAASAAGQTWTRAGRRNIGELSGAHMPRASTRLNPQEGRATCRGIVIDPNQAVIPGAEVTLVNEKTKYKRVVKSDEEGQFKFGLLEPGLYTLKIESPGFDHFQRTHMRLHSNEEMRLDVLLYVGEMGVIVCKEPPGKGIIMDGVRVKINED